MRFIKIKKISKKFDLQVEPFKTLSMRAYSVCSVRAGDGGLSECTELNSRVPDDCSTDTRRIGLPSDTSTDSSYGERGVCNGVPSASVADMYMVSALIGWRSASLSKRVESGLVSLPMYCRGESVVEWSEIERWMVRRRAARIPSVAITSSTSSSRRFVTMTTTAMMTHSTQHIASIIITIKMDNGKPFAV